MSLYGDTSMGGGAGFFPTTIWGRILACRDPESPEYRAGLQYLLSRYWKPVYRYVRIAWNKPNEEAKDLTQDFFAEFLQSSKMAGFEPQGRFRSFLKTALRNFLVDTRRHEVAQKRGRGKAPLSLNSEELEEPPEEGGLTPEQAFDQEWARSLIGEALIRLETQLASEDKAVYFKVFQEMDLQDEDKRPTYEELAKRLGLSMTDVTNFLANVRRRLRRVIADGIREYAVDEEEVYRELLELLGE
ncbi:MAG: sigma-70 family RNA polymerase sigma factor [Planctomycetes bacterium]|nr:sigma-70 family RNA polymerase sigma factor [Planctomycetota bacterium]